LHERKEKIMQWEKTKVRLFLLKLENQGTKQPNTKGGKDNYSERGNKLYPRKMEEAQKRLRETKGQKGGQGTTASKGHGD